jgi:hypothetical protein
MKTGISTSEGNFALCASFGLHMLALIAGTGKSTYNRINRFFRGVPKMKKTSDEYSFKHRGGKACQNF